MKDYTGQIFNLLTVLSQYRDAERQKWFFRCRCDCGREKIARLAAVVRNQTKTCGAYECRIKLNGRHYVRDYTGQKFCRLTILSQEKKGSKWFTLCRCDCGSKTIKSLHSIINGLTKTCGKIECQEKLESFAFERLKKYIGQKFNNLTVLSHFKKGSVWYLRCRCDCGQKRDVRPFYIINNKVKSCDSEKCQYNTARKIDLTGMKFNRLKVIKSLPPELRSNGEKVRSWLCQCDCGKKCKSPTHPLLSGATRSCGCLHKEISKKVGKKCAKKGLICKTLIENSMVLSVVQNVGYRRNGRKIGVTYKKMLINKSKIWMWAASTRFQGKPRYFLFNTYKEALKKRLEIEKKLYWPYIKRNRKLLPEDYDIDYWHKLNSDVKFNPKKYERDKIAGLVPKGL